VHWTVLMTSNASFGLLEAIGTIWNIEGRMGRIAKMTDWRS
jgi:hypothetical protein